MIVVPVAGLAVDADELYREVQAQVEGDVVLQDTVRVGISADAGTGDDQSAASIVEAFARTALHRNGTMFAPRVVLGCVFVGDDAERTAQAGRGLMLSPTLRRLHVQFYEVEARPSAEPQVPDDEFPDDVESERASSATRRPDTATVAEVLEKAVRMMESFEQTPGDAITSQKFVAMVRRPIAPARAPAPRVSVMNLLKDQAAPSEASIPSFERAHRRSTVLARTRPARPTQATALDLLAGTTDAAALVYIVMLPDRGKLGRPVRRRRMEVVVELDRALAGTTLQHGPEADSAAVEIALITAGRRLTRHGVLRTAGQLGHDHVPKVSSEHLDLVSCIDDLVDIHRRDSASLERRGIELTGSHAIFVSTAAPLADSVSIDHFKQLSSLISAWWILFGNAWDLMSTDFEDAGVGVFQEHPDVANELVTAAFTSAPEAKALPGPLEPSSHGAGLER